MKFWRRSIRPDAGVRHPPAGQRGAVREKFDRTITRENREVLVKQFVAKAEWHEPTDFISECRDSKDNRFLELALKCQATILITGDEDLLVLNPFRGTRILTLKEAILETNLPT